MRKTEKKLSYWIRKTHRYLGLFIGIQLFIWTLGGLYFSWTELDNIHGDQFRKTFKPVSHGDLLSPDSLMLNTGIYSLTLKSIDGTPYYWINDSLLVHAQTGIPKGSLSTGEAIAIAGNHLSSNLLVTDIRLVSEVSSHHEYRRKPLPAYEITYENHGNLKAYVSAIDGSFQTVRHRSWRWFDFLWMMHTMDYQGRDNFNNLLIRSFSIMGLITVLSGFLLWFISSKTIRKTLA